MKFNTLLWLLTTGLQFGVGWWYRKQPVFFLPQGWLGPLGWWLALPFAPAGTSLSSLCWCTIQSHPCMPCGHSYEQPYVDVMVCAKYTRVHRFPNAYLCPVHLFLSLNKLEDSPFVFPFFFLQVL